jgi:hypothetical protein
MESDHLKAWHFPTTDGKHYLESAMFSVEEFLEYVQSAQVNPSQLWNCVNNE